MPARPPSAIPSPAPDTPCGFSIEIVLRQPATGRPWQAEVVLDGRHLHFGSLLALIGWLARLEAQGGGIR
jgi:hypothetical protein